MIYIIIAAISGTIYGVYRNIYPFLFSFFLIYIFQKLSNYKEKRIKISQKNNENKTNEKKEIDILRFQFLRKNIYFLDYIFKINEKALLIFLISFIFFFEYISFIEKQNIDLNNKENNRYKFIVLETSEKEYNNLNYIYLINENIYGDLITKKNIKLDIGEKYEGVIEKIKLEGRFNPEGFDERIYFLSKGKNFKGKLKENNILKTKTKEKINIIVKIYKLKNDLKNIFKKYVKNESIIAETLGIKELLSEDIKEAYKNTNTYHILSISGMHMAYIIFFLNIIGIKKENILKNSIFLIFFGILVGNSPSILRSTLMFIVFNILNKFNINIRYIDYISLIFLIIYFLNPYSVFSFGIYLSFNSVIAIKIYFNIFKEKNLKDSKYLFYKKILEIIKINMIIYLFNMPILIYFTYILNLNILFSVFVNIILSFTIPLIMFFSFFIIFSYSFIYLLNFNLIKIHLNKIYYIIGKILEYIGYFNDKIIYFFSKMPISKIYIPRISIISILIYYLLIYFLLRSIYLIKEKKKYILLNII